MTLLSEPKEEIQESKEEPKTIVDVHPAKAKKIQFSHCWCSKCNELVYMVWVEHGVTKRCPHCNKEYKGWIE
jgi:uncharacterized paraquat-inducible protein A